MGKFLTEIIKTEESR